MTELRWDDNYDQKWSDEVLSWDWTLDGSSARLEGPCPRCKHHMSKEIEHGNVAAAMVITEAEAEVQPVVVRCNCGSAHPGRPKDKKGGCGRSAVFHLPL